MARLPHLLYLLNRWVTNTPLAYAEFLNIYQLIALLACMDGVGLPCILSDVSITKESVLQAVLA